MVLIKNRISDLKIELDWKRTTLGEVSTIVGGGTPSTLVREYWDGNINWFTPTEVGKEKYVSQSNRKLTNEGFIHSSARMLPPGAILLTSRAGIGDVAILTEKACTNQGFQSLIANGDLDNEFLYYLVSTLKPEFVKNASGSTFLEISPTKVKAISVTIPPTKVEQTAIANALSDMDSLISNLEKLIEKKRLIKQGVMQELLKPKEGWVIYYLTESCELITKGTTPTSVGQDFKSEGINFIKIESLTAKGEIVANKVAFIDSYTHNILSRSQLKSGDILFSIAGALGRVALVDESILPANTNQALAIIRLKPESSIDKDFLFYYLNSQIIQNHIINISVQGAQANLSLQNISDFKVNCPKDKSEQTKIAIVLRTIDKELTSLEKLHSKYSLTKQGMMQSLLTGKIRLI
jgi:type I restriction enzyme S subunit